MKFNFGDIEAEDEQGSDQDDHADPNGSAEKKRKSQKSMDDKIEAVSAFFL